MGDTIFAVSSGRPPAAIAVIRISGPAAIATARDLAGSLPDPREARMRALRDPDGRLLDRALVIVFLAPATATGEDLVELHCHGGRAVVAAVEQVLTAVDGCRPALPGEFTRRALAHGRMDLAEAEGLADLLEAETEAQRVVALSAAEGRVSQQVGLWLATIAALSARIEAILDHDDEDDVVGGDAEIAAIGAEAERLAADIAAVAAAPPVERLRDGVRIVIAGPPNAGKSTLLNLLAERDVAIVTPIAGTTRDRLEAAVVRDGLPYLLIDTAGLTETADMVEAIGVERAQAAIAAADILLWLSDEAPPRSDALWVHARADLPDRGVVPAGRHIAVRRDDAASVALLWTGIAERAATMVPRADALPLRERHRELCTRAATSLARAPEDPLLLGEVLRQARVILAQITGVDATEMMLDALFSRFCIGK
ncbi:tRNA uridine-5-carboxymethylaminomethyl(34) synthesis GTPase MnmE [Sphingomonas sp. KR1UV-12]|uniref:tRNA modification GTPase MnmE n=1 Tax=Sphingomonas aurea TaxID=3063994 RepID=A0ABT9ELF8_9SPHN|nr:tRNA uridine-5-carboxymethylaminomethyl(34) synthesis GTPase MnmE [Sphingomonas sp. KR1UV-12]MDP1027813.1 tRNA uridine-5-carboxymethylaminomethyl(34) synthesis GTPase MnmE [Sphingomonas sp. KR1UV-12]